jgi:uncharacterized protein (DUF736 family)
MTMKINVKKYDDRDRGALFKNDRKEADTDPDYKGTLNVDGQELWLNAWLKTSKAGSKYMSLSVKPKQPQAARPVKMGDAVPF